MRSWGFHFHEKTTSPLSETLRLKHSAVDLNVVLFLAPTLIRPQISSLIAILRYGIQTPESANKSSIRDSYRRDWKCHNGKRITAAAFTR